MTESNIENSEHRPQSQRRKALFAVVLIIGAIIAARYFGLGSLLTGAKDWIASLGVWGPVVFIILYVVGAIAAAPGSALTIAAGALFGALWGTIIVSIASTVGAGAAFLIARYLARESIENRLKTNEKFQKLLKITEKQGDIIVAITRLVPLFPYNLLNYGFGLTRVKFRTYIFYSWLCMLPATVLYVAGTDAVFRAAADGEIAWPLVALAGAVFLVLAVLINLARKRLSDGDRS